MSKNSSSASTEKIMPAGKPSSSFMTESEKSGALGSVPISVSQMAEPGRDTSKSKIIDDTAKKGNVSFDGTKEVMPASKPSSTFINTSAVK